MIIGGFRMNFELVGYLDFVCAPFFLRIFLVL